MVINTHKKLDRLWDVEKTVDVEQNIRCNYTYNLGWLAFAAILYLGYLALEIAGIFAR